MQESKPSQQLQALNRSAENSLAQSVAICTGKFVITPAHENSDNERSGSNARHTAFRRNMYVRTPIRTIISTIGHSSTLHNPQMRTVKDIANIARAPIGQREKNTCCLK